MRQERLLSVGTDGGGYISLCTNKDDISLKDLSVSVNGVATAFRKARHRADNKQDVVFTVRPRHLRNVLTITFVRDPNV